MTLFNKTLWIANANMPISSIFHSLIQLMIKSNSFRDPVSSVGRVLSAEHTPMARPPIKVFKKKTKW